MCVLGEAEERCRRNWEGRRKGKLWLGCKKETDVKMERCEQSECVKH